MRRMTLVATLLASCLVAAGASAGSTAETLQAFFAASFEERLRDSPEFSTSIGRHDYDDRWSDWSRGGRSVVHEHLLTRLRQIDALPTDGITDADRLSVRLLRYMTQSDLDAEDLEVHLLRLQQLFGLHTRVYLTIDRMPARALRDYQNIVARLRAIPAYVDQNIGILQEAAERGLTQPSVVVDRVVEQLQRQTAQSAEQSALLEAFRHFPSTIAASDQAQLGDAAKRAYGEQFLPAWGRLRDYLAGPYRAKQRAKIGVDSVPNGRAAYATLIRRLTTTSRTPEEIHQLGLGEIQRIEALMQGIARETGFVGDLAAFNHHLEQMPEQHFASRDDMLVYCRNVAKIIEPNLPALFRRIPVLLYGVRAIPEDRERSTASNAQAPTPDGLTPGWFNLNTYQPEQQVRFDKQALTLHEAVPGHVFQGAVARSIAGLPEFRKYYGNSAYAEGWALYAESLGGELGIYRDPFSRYGQLSSERFRAVRLVVDTGMHAFGWSREKALEFFKEHAPEEAVAEIDRYISWPGQALAYKLGQLEIRSLRAEAEQQLGARFDIRDFHDAVLRDGVLPLDLLREQVQRYIAAAR
jgi:uncharacterized protein (DUF885 family)